MRDPRPERRDAKEILVELGGWFEQLGPAELRATSNQRTVFLDHRLALVSGTSVGALQRLGGSRRVHTSLGSSCTPSRPPDDALEGLRGSYAIRFHDRYRRLSNVDRRLVMSAMWHAHSAPRVDLRNPDHDVHVYVTDDGLWFGELLTPCAPELRGQRARRPFVRSYEMPPRKARVLVNLSGVQRKGRFLDPFCGTGSLVIEAARVGCDAAGSDADIRAVRGAAANAAHEGVDAFFFAADACAPPLECSTPTNSVACDLPYGRSAGRRGVAGRHLYEAFLTGLGDAVAVGGRAVVVSVPEDVPARAPAGWDEVWCCREEARTVVRTVTVWCRAPL